MNELKPGDLVRATRSTSRPNNGNIVEGSYYLVNEVDPIDRDFVSVILDQGLACWTTTDSFEKVSEEKYTELLNNSWDVEKGDMVCLLNCTDEIWEVTYVERFHGALELGPLCFIKAPGKPELRVRAGEIEKYYRQPTEIISVY